MAATDSSGHRASSSISTAIGAQYSLGEFTGGLANQFLFLGQSEHTSVLLGRRHMPLRYVKVITFTNRPAGAVFDDLGPPGRTGPSPSGSGDGRPGSQAAPCRTGHVNSRQPGPRIRGRCPGPAGIPRGGGRPRRPGQGIGLTAAPRSSRCPGRRRCRASRGRAGVAPLHLVQQGDQDAGAARRRSGGRGRWRRR